MPSLRSIDIRIISLLKRRPSKFAYGREIKDALGNTWRSIKDSLNKLSDMGLIQKVPTCQCGDPATCTRPFHYSDSRIKRVYVLDDYVPALLRRWSALEIREKERLEELKGVIDTDPEVYGPVISDLQSIAEEKRKIEVDLLRLPRR